MGVGSNMSVRADKQTHKLLDRFLRDFFEKQFALFVEDV